MWLRPTLGEGFTRAPTLCRPLWSSHRRLMTLAIETSCDDTSVAIVEKSPGNERPSAHLHFHKKVTSNNAEYQGVHPLVSLRSHQENLASLVSEAISHLPPKNCNHGDYLEAGASKREERGEKIETNIATKRLPDFISVTRGPGMRSNLFTGLDTAKGLAAAWQVLNDTPSPI
jgi:N6-L-threonylcarbamoyladenine synthase